MTELTQQERENVALVNRYVEEVWNEGNLDALDDLLAEEYVNDSFPPGTPPGQSGLEQTISMVRGGFPDLTLTPDDTVAEDDKVVQRWTGRGTHTGELMGVPPSGKEVSYQGISIYHVKDGKIAQDWTNVDLMGIMQQIGAAPGPG